MATDPNNTFGKILFRTARQMYSKSGATGVQIVNLCHPDPEDETYTSKKFSTNVETLKADIIKVADSLAIGDFPLTVLSKADAHAKAMEENIDDEYGGDTHRNNMKIGFFSEQINSLTTKAATKGTAKRIIAILLAVWLSLVSEGDDFLLDQEDYCGEKVASKMLPKLYGNLQVLLTVFTDAQLGITSLQRRAILLSMGKQKNTVVGCDGGWGIRQNHMANVWISTVATLQ
eukprot:PhF_6_TR5207/c0_g1_i2/m.7508